jgi:hypothetical protein
MVTISADSELTMRLEGRLLYGRRSTGDLQHEKPLSSLARAFSFLVDDPGY